MQTLKKTCCLGMVALCASVSFAVDSLQTQATFESPVVTDKPIPMDVHLTDGGTVDNNDNSGYWTLNGDVNKTELGDQAELVAYDEGAAPTDGGTQYLKLDLQDRLDRNINSRITANENGGTSPKADTIAEGEGSLYFDSLVQFTASDAESGVDLMEDMDKLLVWLKEGTTAEDGTATPAQLMVTAGYMSDANNYTIEKHDYAVEGAAIAPDEWHRLTIQAVKQAIPGLDGSYEIVFRVLIDGQAVTCADARGVDGSPTAQMSNDLFPAFVQTYTLPDFLNLTAATFKGMGAVDNMAWSRESPIEIVNEVTFVLGDGVASVTVTPDGGEAATYTEKTTLQFTGKYEYVFNAQPGYCEPEVTLDGNTITAVAKIGVASIGDTLYPSFEAAFGAIPGEEVTTIKMLRDDTVKTEFISNETDLILDLNGHTLAVVEMEVNNLTVLNTGALDGTVQVTVYGTLTVGAEGAPANDTSLQINVSTAVDRLVMYTGCLAQHPSNNEDGGSLAAGMITVPNGYKFAQADGVWKLVADGGEDPTDPTVTAGADADKVTVDTSAKTITITESTGTELTVANATDYTISVPANVEKINGTVKGVVVKAGDLDITGAFTVAGDGSVMTIALDPNGKVMVGDEEVTVDPVVADVATAEDAAVTVKAIPGLTYTLLRATEVKGTYTAVDATAVIANEVTTTLTDASADRPADAAFYKVQVSR